MYHYGYLLCKAMCMWCSLTRRMLLWYIVYDHSMLLLADPQHDSDRRPVMPVNCWRELPCSSVRADFWNSSLGDSAYLVSRGSSQSSAFRKGGCSGRGVQWMGVVLYSKLVHNIIQITTPCFHCIPLWWIWRSFKNFEKLIEKRPGGQRIRLIHKGRINATNNLGSRNTVTSRCRW